MASEISHVDHMVSGLGIMPWHRLGTVVEGYLTAAEALQKAKLGWQVTKDPIYTGAGDKIEDNFVMMRSDTKTPLGIVGKRYVPIQNQDGLDILDPVIGKEAVYETAGSLRGGKIVWFLAKLNKEYFLRGNDDRAKQYCLVFLSHDGSKPVTVRFTTTRVVCANTLSMAVRGTPAEVSIRHLGKYADKVSEAHKVLRLADEHAQKFAKLMLELEEQKISENTAKQAIELVFPGVTDRNVEIRANVFGRFMNGMGNSGRTKADFINGVSEYTTHRELRASKALGMDERKTQDVLFGDAQKINNFALEVIGAL